MTEERALIDRAVRGDAEAMRQIVAAHRPVAFRVARALLEESEAEDVTPGGDGPPDGRPPRIPR